MDEEAVELSNPVKAVRISLGLTQEEMAERIGCSYMTARRCEYEARLPTNRAVLKNLQELATEASIKLSIFNKKYTEEVTEDDTTSVSSVHHS